MREAWPPFHLRGSLGLVCEGRAGCGRQPRGCRDGRLTWRRACYQRVSQHPCGGSPCPPSCPRACSPPAWPGPGSPHVQAGAVRLWASCRAGASALTLPGSSHALFSQRPVVPADTRFAFCTLGLCSAWLATPGSSPFGVGRGCWLCRLTRCPGDGIPGDPGPPGPWGPSCNRVHSSGQLNPWWSSQLKCL